MSEDEKRTKAWVGDAVLSLAREWIPGDASIQPSDRNEAFIRMTQTSFSSVGEPTAMEAEIGRIYESEGLDAAYKHIEETTFLFKKQQVRPQQPGSYRTRRKK